MNRRIYILYAEWDNTKNNHAGMGYLARELAANNDCIKIIRSPIINFRKYKISSFDKLNSFLSRISFKSIKVIYQIFFIIYLFLRIRKEDNLVFFEYLTDTGYKYFQEEIARKIFKYRSFDVYGLIHLPFSYLKTTERFGTDEKILKYLQYIDYAIVFGSSLENDIRSIYPELEVIRLLHYVDTNYYTPSIKVKNENDKLKIIVSGAIMRNYTEIINIINSAPNYLFYFCIGKNSIDLSEFLYDNVIVKNYIEEDELKLLMQDSNISLNILNDTVGSNVITTSMACGLCIIVNDVGSIRDYCDSSNAFFCNNSNDVLKVLESIEVNRSILEPMYKSSKQKSSELSIKSFQKKFMNSIFNHE
jgi:hypothetical protein